jgi:hypothetical protein
MSHYIQAIIFKTEQVKSIADKFPNSRFANLRQGITLIPMEDELFDFITESSVIKNNDIPTDNFTYVNSSIFGLLCDISRNCQIGYIETDYFGGTGTQTAILFDNGKVYGPYHTNTVKQAPKRAINTILEKLGVSKQHYWDEFEAIGLSDFRNNSVMIDIFGIE